MAHRDRPVHPPVATHQRYVPGESQRHDVTLEGEALPWVSMAEALGWQEGRVGFPRRADDGEATEDGYRERDFRATDEPAFNLTEKARSWTRAPTHYDRRQGSTNPDTGVRTEARPVPVDEPAPTIAAQGLSKGRDVWVHDRPATNVNCDTRISPPGRHDPDVSGSQQEGAIRVTETEAAILQSFRPDYPWQGSRTKRFEQIGNAVPPLLAAAVLRCLVDVPDELEAAA